MNEKSQEVKIPIKNIYCLLCYAWNKLARDADTMCGEEKFDNIYNLMARLLSVSVGLLVRQGFHREYVETEEELSSLHGRLELSQSVARQTMQSCRMVCRFDKLSEDVPFNQIIKASIHTLLQYDKLDPKYRKTLTELLVSFAGISDIRPNRRIFSELKFNRNNQNYRLIINVCWLLYDGLITTEEDGKLYFADFIRDRQMSALYEAFVRNFYRIHLPRTEYRVHSPKFTWKMEEENMDREFLPEMRTDIVLEDRISHTQLIIDTKFYKNLFTQQRRFGEKKTFKSENLYQITAYVRNSGYDGRVMGLLLYPVTEMQLNKRIPLKEGPVMVSTLNLAEEWERIEKNLLELAKVTREKWS